MVAQRQCTEIMLSEAAAAAAAIKKVDVCEVAGTASAEDSSSLEKVPRQEEMSCLSEVVVMELEVQSVTSSGTLSAHLCDLSGPLSSESSGSELTEKSCSLMSTASACSAATDLTDADTEIELGHDEKATSNSSADDTTVASTAVPSTTAGTSKARVLKRTPTPRPQVRLQLYAANGKLKNPRINKPLIWASDARHIPECYSPKATCRDVTEETKEDIAAELWRLEQPEERIVEQTPPSWFVRTLRVLVPFAGCFLHPNGHLSS